MIDKLTDSLLLFWTAGLYGFWIQSIYQCILGIRIMIPHVKLLYWLEDLIYWNMSAIFTYQMFFRMNFGQIRGYAIAGLLIGMLISYFTVGALLKSVSGKIRKKYLRLKSRISRKREAKKEKIKAKKEAEREKKEKNNGKE